MIRNVMKTQSRQKPSSTRGFVQMTVACVLALGACAAHASDAGRASDEKPSVEVDYSDLNLDSPRGLDALRTRIARAAHQVCSNQQISETRTSRRFQECVRTATSEAFQQVKWPPRGI